MSTSNGLTNSSGANRWAKSPKYLLRADAITRITRDCEPGRFLEIGAGTGELTQTFVERGFSGLVYDLGERTRDELRLRFADSRGRVSVVDRIEDVPDGSVDYLFAFEVLEHIVDDIGALAQWRIKLRPRGRIVVSVPAHQRAFGPTDIRVGHIRRYERAQLKALLEGAGLKVESFVCYGFPLGNIGRIVGNLLDQGAQPTTVDAAKRRSIVSGVEQSRAVVRMGVVLNRWTLAPFVMLQRLFFATDFGDGYVASATRPRLSPR